MIKTIIFAITFAIVIMLGIYYFQIPDNAIVTVPGEINSLDQEIEMETNASINKVGVYRLTINKKWDLIEYMWNHKTFVTQYSYNEFDSDSEMVVSYLKDDLEASELKLDMFTVIWGLSSKPF